MAIMFSFVRYGPLGRDHSWDGAASGFSTPTETFPVDFTDSARPAPSLALAQGDWVPKHLLIDDGAIVGVIDWEFARPASPAYDFATWEVSAGDGLHDRSALLRLGYA
jgi:aminoglycoside phosphotransferase (APT) family kinase protein